MNLCAAFGPWKYCLSDDQSHKDYCRTRFILSKGGGFRSVILANMVVGGSTSEEAPSKWLKLCSFKANRDDPKPFLLAMDFICRESQ